MKGKRIGYARVSTIDQHPENQLHGIEIDKLFIEKAGAYDERPVLKEMLNYLRDDDVLYIQRIDRIARNPSELRDIVQKITDKKASVTFLHENFTIDSNRSPASLLMLTVIGAFGELETSIRAERTREGIERGRREGKYKGRKPSISMKELEKLKEMIYDLGMSKAKVGRAFNISTPTVYAYLRGASRPYDEVMK